MTPRFRFAPSPTGDPHIGNLHTALFSWALARAMDGEFIIRIEDTDQERHAPGAVERMLDALAWLGIDWDEGPDVGGPHEPYVQSLRLPRHQAAIERLLEDQHAYYGDDPERPAAPGGKPLRLRMPRTGQTIVNDAIRGPINFDNRHLKDPVLVRSDGQPLYHLAATVDDHDMEISHVVRGEEWLASSPVHVRLVQALGWAEPVWVHLPLILDRQGRKLKKRDGKGDARIGDLQAAGYLPETVFNALLLLGWAPDDAQEVISKAQVRRQFRLERLSASPSIFDWEKLDWINRQYVQALSDSSLAARIRPYLEQAYDLEPLVDEWLVRLTAVIRDGLVRLGDAMPLSAWAFDDELAFTEDGLDALRHEAARPVLTRLVAEIAAVVLLDEHTADSMLRTLRADFEAKQGWEGSSVLQPIRAALTGDKGGPPLHQVMGIIGRERTLRRLGVAFELAGKGLE